MTRNSPMQLGLVSHENERWIAGVLYIQTVMRAMAALPSAQQPDMHLWLRRGSDPSFHQAHEDLIRSKHVYDALSHQGFANTIKFHRRSLVRHGRLSRSLVEHAAEAGMELLFPCHQSLGPAAPLPWIGWIPDFQHLHLPELFSESARNKRDRVYGAMIHEANHMVVSSETARCDLLDAYDADPQQLSVYRFRTWADPAWFEDDPRQLADKHGLPKRFLMFPSQFWRHKDHLVLFEALKQLKGSGEEVHLVLTGKDKDYRHPDHAPMLHDYLQQHELESQVHYLGLLPRHEQIQLMRCAAAVVQPSRFEGWSMLVEDCRALGKKMILSDIAVHQEQDPPQACYFPVGDAGALADVIADQWPSLIPGPDLDAENQAREENARLILEGGQSLMQVFEQVLKS